MRAIDQYKQYGGKAISAFGQDMRLGGAWLIRACSFLVTLWLVVGCVESSKVISIDPSSARTPSPSTSPSVSLTVRPFETYAILEWTNPSLPTGATIRSILINIFYTNNTLFKQETFNGTLATNTATSYRVTDLTTGIRYKFGLTFSYSGTNIEDTTTEQIERETGPNEDGDDRIDKHDAFPTNATESLDSDNDTIGDNADTGQFNGTLCKFKADCDDDGITDDQDTGQFNGVSCKIKPDCDDDGIRDDQDIGTNSAGTTLCKIIPDPCPERPGVPGGPSGGDTFFNSIIPQELSVELNWTNPRPNRDTEGIYRFTISWVAVTPTRDQLQDLIASTGIAADMLENEVDQAYRQANHSAVLDLDQDGIVYSADNCLHIANPSQADADRDGVGDACDPMNSSLHFVPGNKQVNISWLNPVQPSEYENSASSIVDNSLTFSLANNQLIVNWTNPNLFNGDAVNITLFTIHYGTSSVPYTPQTGEKISAAEVSRMLTLNSLAPGGQHTITLNATNSVNGVTTIYTIATGCAQIATSSLVAPCGSTLLPGVTLNSFTLSISNASITNNILIDTTQPGFSSAYGNQSYYFYNNSTLIDSEYDVTLSATYSNGMTARLTERDSPTNHPYQASIRLGPNYDGDALADVVDSDMDNDGILNNADNHPRRSAQQDSIVLEYKGDSNSIAFYQADNTNSYQVDGLSNRTYYNFMTTVHFRSYTDSTAAQSLGYQALQTPIAGAIEEAETNQALVVNQYIVRTGVNTDNDNLVNILDPDDDDDTLLDSVDTGHFGGSSCQLKADCDGDGTNDNHDAFPRNDAEAVDTDEDRVGDNADQCPNGLRSWSSTAAIVDRDQDGCHNDEDIDDNNNQLIELSDETTLRAMVLNGTGLMLTTGGINTSGCPGDCNGYELTNDITLVMDWDPIGEDTDLTMAGCQGPAFNTIFNGHGYSIKNIGIDTPQTDCVGFFSHLGNQAQIQFVNLEAQTIRGNNFVGSLAGSGQGATIMSSSAIFNQLDGQNYIGGLIGNGMDIRLTSSYATANTVAGNMSIGGLLGNGANSNIHTSYVVMINISGKGQGIGGLVGTAQQADINGSYTVINNISGNTNIGGLIGNSEDSIITNSYTLFHNIFTTQNKGGLIGTAQNSNIFASYWDTDISIGITSDSQGKTTLLLQDDGTNMIYADWIQTSCLNRRVDTWNFTMGEYPVLNCTPDTPAQQRGRWSVVSNLLKVLIR